MSLEKGLAWTYKNLDFKGYSIAGQCTSIYFNTPKICFDISQGLPFHINAKLYCLSHLHADHGSGLNYLLSQRSLFRLPQAKIMLPAEHVESVERILTEWRKIEGFEYDYELIPSHHDELYHFSDQYKVRPFKTTHRVSSFGYIVYESKKKLKEEYRDCNSFQIVELKKQGQQIEETVDEPIVAFTGDTQIEFIHSHPDVAKAKLLFVECTYLDKKKTIEETRKWGHLHLDEIIENLGHFKNEHISLIHLSARYQSLEANRILNEKIPSEKRDNFSIFPRPF